MAYNVVYKRSVERAIALNGNWVWYSSKSPSKLPAEQKLQEALDTRLLRYCFCAIINNQQQIAHPKNHPPLSLSIPSFKSGG